MPVRQKDAQRALELLQQYRLRLTQRPQSPGGEDDQQLQRSLERVISVFQSQLFNALLDIQEYYELSVQADAHDAPTSELTKLQICPESSPSGPSPSAPLRTSTENHQSPHVPSQSPPRETLSKPLISPKPKSFKSPAPPVPQQPATLPSTSPLQPQSSKKYRAPLPPMQDRVSAATGGDRASHNGFDPSDPQSEYATIAPQPAVTPGEHATVSALVSGTVQGLLPATTTTPVAAPALPAPSQAEKDQDVSVSSEHRGSSQTRDWAEFRGPSSPSRDQRETRDRTEICGPSPTISPGPFAKGPLRSPTSLSPSSLSPRPVPPKTPVKVRPSTNHRRLVRKALD
ncbi:unnamed protein product [Knipowitschia caucasica]